MKKILSLIFLFSIATTQQTFGMQRLFKAFIGACKDINKSINQSIGTEMYEETTEKEDEQYNINPYERLPSNLLVVFKKTCEIAEDFCLGYPNTSDKIFIWMCLEED